MVIGALLYVNEVYQFQIKAPSSLAASSLLSAPWWHLWFGIGISGMDSWWTRKKSSLGRFRKKLQFQGARISRNDGYLPVRRNDEGWSKTLKMDFQGTCLEIAVCCGLSWKKCTILPFILSLSKDIKRQPLPFDASTGSASGRTEYVELLPVKIPRSGINRFLRNRQSLK